MIEYSKFASDTNHRIRDLTWMNAGRFAVAGVCVLPISLYYLVVGIAVSASAAIKLGFQILTMVAVLLAIYLIVYTKVKKAVKTNFEEYEIDGKIDFTVERIDEDTLEFTRLTDEESFQVSRADIKKIKRLKNTIVIILKNKTTIDLPKRTDIDELITL